MRQIKLDLSKIFNRYGRKMELKAVEGESAVSFKGLLQPLRYKNKMYLNQVSTEISYTNTRKFLLICPAAVNISEADGYNKILIVGEDKYCVDHSEKIYGKNEAVYSWSIVHQVNL